MPVYRLFPSDACPITYSDRDFHAAVNALQIQASGSSAGGHFWTPRFVPLTPSYRRGTLVVTSTSLEITIRNVYVLLCEPSLGVFRVEWTTGRETPAPWVGPHAAPESVPITLDELKRLWGSGMDGAELARAVFDREGAFRHPPHSSAQ